MKPTRTITRIFLHCTASAQSWTIADVQAEFRRKGWKYPGYHYVITADGVTHQLLDESMVANGVKGYNQTAVHIAYVGGIRARAGKIVGEDNRTPAQRASMRILLQTLRARYPDAQIMGHRDIWGHDKPEKWKKECPCFDATTEYSDV